MIDEYEAYEAYLNMIKEIKISDWFTNSFTITADDLHLVGKIVELMGEPQTSLN